MAARSSYRIGDGAASQAMVRMVAECRACRLLGRLVRLDGLAAAFLQPFGKREFHAFDAANTGDAPNAAPNHAPAPLRACRVNKGPFKNYRPDAVRTSGNPSTSP